MSDGTTWRLSLAAIDFPPLPNDYLDARLVRPTAGDVQGTLPLDDGAADGHATIQTVATTVGIVLVGVVGREHADTRLVVTVPARTIASTPSTPARQHQACSPRLASTNSSATAPSVPRQK
jgi:hypothetical protein